MFCVLLIPSFTFAKISFPKVLYLFNVVVIYHIHEYDWWYIEICNNRCRNWYHRFDQSNAKRYESEIDIKEGYRGANFTNKISENSPSPSLLPLPPVTRTFKDTSWIHIRWGKHIHASFKLLQSFKNIGHDREGGWGIKQ